MKTRTVNRLLYAHEADMGGLPIRQPIPTQEVDQIDPFLLLHHADIKVPTHLKPDHAGVGPHPHRGFSPWNKIFDTLNPNNKEWVKEAPLLIVSLFRRNFLRNGMTNQSAEYDLGAANAFLSLQATALGLNIHQMGGFDHPKAANNLRIPESFGLGVIMAVGYHGDADNLPEKFRERENSPRVRNIQEEFVSNKSW